MSDMDRKRDYVAKLYSGDRWKNQVKKMSDAQVTAVYLKAQTNPPTPKKKEDPDVPF